MLFKKGQLGASGGNKFLFDHAGLVEAHHPDPNTDREAAAIEAGANEIETLTPEQNDDIQKEPQGRGFSATAQRCMPSPNGSRPMAGRS